MLPCRRVALRMEMSRTRRYLPRLLAVCLFASACDGYHLDGPVDPEPLSPPRTVSVTVEYLQPNGCVEGSPRCEDNVVFFGSWMRPGEEFFLQPQAGRFLWRGTATNVPVNFPPRGAPHAVRIYDPHIVGTPSTGLTASRLKVGGEAITVIDSPGNPREVGLVYIDENGQGRNPY
jgi:hypothetical protein